MTAKKPILPPSKRYPDKAPVDPPSLSAGDGVIVGFVLCLIIVLVGVMVIPLPQEREKPPVVADAQVSQAQFDALSDAKDADIERITEERNKYKLDYETVLTDAKSNIQNFESQRKADLDEIATLKNRPPKIIHNTRSLDECLGKLDDARAALHEKNGQCARRLGE